jgi:hypothetical protein
MPSSLVNPIYKNVIRYLGDPQVPHDIQHRRRQNMETMRRLGTPVLIKHKYNIDDVSSGEAESTSNWDTIYKQSEYDDPLSYGAGFCSVETARNEWIRPASEEDNAELVISASRPEEEYIPAPLYRGWGQGYLTYVILPDVPMDVFKLTDEGALIKIQQARIQLPWWPQVGDNDLMIVVELNATEKIINTFERYSLKKVNPISMRGRDRWGRREFESGGGNRFLIGNYCEANKIPETDPAYLVEIDR